MDYDELMKLLLKEVDSNLNSDDFPENPYLKDLGEQKFINMLHDAQSEGYLSTRSYKDGIVTLFMGGGFLVNSTTYLTSKGRKFIEGKLSDTNSSVNYHIGSVSHSNVGNYGTVNNYGISFADLKAVIDGEISNESDKKEADALVEIIEKEPIKPNLLTRFDGLLKKYPNIAEATAKALLTLATGGFGQ
ncbi:hypothetical protein I6I78_09260 [Enterococcus casseliflavus]|uniref:hypothetical protein n=1 Tax=Enterococcus casseliflavus TaxID=37734 RepID=UPI00191935EB|nr:hypothetical protein [Enterococcus casseliflavus]QQU18442.1 hypothetical protein I6I78_09260 [Enterococcus casseliflavus]